ncbi:DUF932 domain-containing protein [Patescibacteria group bacterium]|nr:DUF932 domain-containing protein [Patescibacteria group bacterium]
MELTRASREWASRPNDERYLDLPSMRDRMYHTMDKSRTVVASCRQVQAIPTDDNQGILIEGPNGQPYAPTHWAFGQLCQRASSPAGYLRDLPAPLAADCLNYGLKFRRDIEDIGFLLEKDESPVLRAATGPAYGRIWNAGILDHVIDRFGDGVTGDFRVPGEFGKAVTITKENTTLYASDRDMFIFLADENHKIEVPNRRNGEPGLLSRGFFLWNSEVGSATFGIGTFLFDYVCCNRIVWGATGYKEIKIRHTVSAPDRFIEQAQPILLAYANGSEKPIQDAIANAKAHKLDDVNEWLTKRFSKSTASALQAVHKREEARPIETMWDVTVAATAHARSIPYQNERVELERKAGELLDF